MGHADLMRATVSPKEAAELLGTNKKAVMAWIKRGESPFFTLELSPRRKLYRAYADELVRLRPTLPRCPMCNDLGLSDSGACQTHVARVTQTGAVRSPCARARMRQAKLGTTRPPETRAKISATLRRQRERGGKNIICPGCGKARYRSPSGIGSEWCAGCWRTSPQGQASLASAQERRKALIHAELQDLREWGRLTTGDIARRLLVSRPVVTAHYIGAGLLAAEPRASVAGGVRLVAAEGEVARFCRDWALAVRQGDARRNAWLDPEFVVGWMKSRGVVDELAAGPLAEADVEEAVRRRVRARRRAILPCGGGRPPSETVPARHLAWSRELDAIEAALWEEHERDLNLQLAPGRRPSRWDAARELGHRLDPANPAAATRKVWKADKKVKSLQIVGNQNYPGT